MKTVDTFGWFTHVRRFPQLIGKTPDGRRIWGGPYTQTQVMATAGILFLGSKTQHLWGVWGLLGDSVALLSVAGGIGFLLGRVPIGMRNPVTILLEVWSSLSAPSTGRYSGRPIRLPRPHRARRRRVLIDPSSIVILPPASAEASADAPEQVSAPAVPAPRPTAPLTGVQRLLAGIEKD